MLRESPLYAYFPARDLDRARRFYEETLGFVPKSVDEGGVTYEFGGGTGEVISPVVARVSNRRKNAFGWCVRLSVGICRQV